MPMYPLEGCSFSAYRVHALMLGSSMHEGGSTVIVRPSGMGVMTCGLNDAHLESILTSKVAWRHGRHGDIQPASSM